MYSRTPHTADQLKSRAVKIHRSPGAVPYEDRTDINLEIAKVLGLIVPPPHTRWSIEHHRAAYESRSLESWAMGWRRQYRDRWRAFARRSRIEASSACKMVSNHCLTAESPSPPREQFTRASMAMCRLQGDKILERTDIVPEVQ
jgi:hypothetical protein